MSVFVFNSSALLNPSPSASSSPSFIPSPSLSWFEGSRPSFLSIESYSPSPSESLGGKTLRVMFSATPSGSSSPISVVKLSPIERVPLYQVSVQNTTM
ncbi:MAG: hypothetical protein DRN90_06415 [Thermoproteota archaeon]|nr:MAG: hypothetical protein DRN90_06415 [Candidatus Korarchaeota archaeon]